MTLSGTVTYRARIALPPDAVIRVRLDDASRPDTTTAPIAEQIISTGGRQVPIAFELPVADSLLSPTGRFALRALLDAQELDSRASTGTVYWEGLVELLAPGGARVGLGYLEMTGRAQPLRLG